MSRRTQGRIGRVERRGGFKREVVEGQEGAGREGAGGKGGGETRGKQGERKEDAWRRRGAEMRSSRVRKGVEKMPRMRELVQEGMKGRVGLEGKSAAKDTFTICLEDSCGDLVDGLTKPFRT
jgi:hypothetical protein